jgi:pimeloyl-ACP methyl ester carboxylesterase
VALAACATVVLVHGAFHGAWCWSRVVAGLEARGVSAVALDLPGHGESPSALGGLPDDAAFVRARVEACREPVVLCGHSYGGMVISEAADAQGPVRHLVYLAAVAPDPGESLVAALPAEATARMSAALHPNADGSVSIDPARALELFYQDCDAELARWAVARLGPQRPESLLAPVTRAAWREIESTYVVCERDGAIDAPAQRRLARRCGRRLSWPTCHAPMLSQPERVVELLAGLANEVAAKPERG